MNKTFVFLRGVESPFKREVSKAIMEYLNPDINHIRAIRIALRDFASDLGDKDALKSAANSCKNLCKKVLGGNHAERFIVLDNESLLPQHWQSFYNLGDSTDNNTIGVGINIESSKNIYADLEQKKLNLQDQKLQVFKDALYKYYDVKTIDDLGDVFRGLDQLIERI